MTKDEALEIRRHAIGILKKTEKYLEEYYGFKPKAEAKKLMEGTEWSEAQRNILTKRSNL